MKKGFCVLLSVLFLLSGCAAAPAETTAATQTVPMAPPAAATETAPTAPQTQPVPEVTEVTVWQTEPPPVTESIPTQPQLPEIRDLEQFRHQLYYALEQGQRELKFRYLGDPGDLTAQRIARIGGAFYVERERREDVYLVRIWDYPGDRMVRAHQTGNYGDLKDGEAQALDMALAMVAQARERAVTDLELELALFDLLRNHVTYHDGDTDIQDPQAPPRHLTAVGALVDGQANCQGYADGFYVLAALAGFQVGRMHVDIPGGGHTVNVIRLGQSWYIVDATYNDNPEPSDLQLSYRLFNAGKSQCMEYNWEPMMERWPIAQDCDSNYYYYMPHTDEERAFADLDSMAGSLLRDWTGRGVGTRYVMLENRVADWDDLAEALNAAANAAGEFVSYHIWAENNGKSTYFLVKLE